MKKGIVRNVVNVAGYVILCLLIPTQMLWAGWLDSAVENAAQDSVEKIVHRAADEGADAAYDKAKQSTENDTRNNTSNRKSSRAVTTGSDSGDGAGDLKDPPQFSGMSGHYVLETQDKDFDSYGFCDGKKIIPIEGRVWKKHYNLKDGAKQPSAVQIVRNYTNALKKMGGSVVADVQLAECGQKQYCGDRVFSGKLLKGGGELWIEVEPCNDGFDYWLTVVQKETMKNEVTANAMLEALEKDGHIALYINFDTGKSVIKTESKPIIEQIIVMMMNDTNLNVTIEGHTDNVGNAKSNKLLSEARANSVVSALVKEGVDRKRLSAVGFGQDKPVADNKTFKGREQNRRVELVKR